MRRKRKRIGNAGKTESRECLEGAATLERLPAGRGGKEKWRQPAQPSQSHCLSPFPLSLVRLAVAVASFSSDLSVDYSLQRCTVLIPLSIATLFSALTARRNLGDCGSPFYHRAFFSSRRRFGSVLRE